MSDDNNNNKGLLEYCSGISSRKSSAPPFLLKTYMLVEDGATNDVISWNDEGTAFVVWQPAEFARDLLPTLFKHSNFSSFVRQLNTYVRIINSLSTNIYIYIKIITYLSLISYPFFCPFNKKSIKCYSKKNNN